MKITNNTLIKRRKSVIYKSVDGVVYLLDTANSTIHTLNKTASFIWEYLEKTHTFKTVVDAMCENFEIKQKAAAKDCAEFISDYIKLGFLETGKAS